MKGLNYRSPVGDTPGTFAQWLRDLRNQSGAYIIRSAQTKEVLYVGESHTGNLAKTLGRHFHTWRDDPERQHFTYSRHHAEVAVRVTPPGSAAGAQDNLIQRLKPRDNSSCLRCEADPF